jgi:tetratricopeptide (TPR) repeat protein
MKSEGQPSQGNPGGGPVHAPDPVSAAPEFLADRAWSGTWRRLTRGRVLVALSIAVALGAGLAGYRVIMTVEPPAARGGAEPDEAAEAPAYEPPARAETASAETPTPPPLSWTAAEQAYASRKCDEALAIYTGLLSQSEKNPINRPLSDFLRLRQGQCLRGLDRIRESRKALLDAAGGATPLVRAIACFELARLDAVEGQSMMARMRAYQALGAMGPVTDNPGLDTDCEFLAAQAVTAKALSLFGKNLPAPPLGTDANVFDGLTDSQLRALLDAGADRVAAAILDPTVVRAPADRGISRWTVVSNNAPLDEVLSRVTAATGLDARWEGVNMAARRRPLVLDTGGLAAPRLIEVIAGAAGLVARFRGTEVVLSDPAVCSSTGEARDLLVRESVSAWRRFLLRGPNDAREAYGHFALAAIQHQAGEGGAAIAEYRVVAERFPLDRLAPDARLRMAIIRIELRDYTGARTELLDLLNHYPDCPESDEAYLHLGEAELEAGRMNEALATFKKLYFLDLSLASRASAAHGAAKSSFRQTQYDEAARWLGRRLELPRSPAIDADLPEVYNLLAKTEAARGRLPEAVAAYREAVRICPKGADRADRLLELARILIQQENYVSAAGVLSGFGPNDLTTQQAEEVLLTRAQIFRHMHVPDRAVTLLRHALPTASSAQMKSRMTYELAGGMADGGDLRGAFLLLNDLLQKVEAGPLADRVALDLAGICLRLGRSAQAVALAGELLKSSCGDDVRRAAQNILGRAYSQQKEYERAAIALSGVAVEHQGAPKP